MFMRHFSFEKMSSRERERDMAKAFKFLLGGNIPKKHKDIKSQKLTSNQKSTNQN